MGIYSAAALSSAHVLLIHVTLSSLAEGKNTLLDSSLFTIEDFLMVHVERLHLTYGKGWNAKKYFANA